MLDAVEVLTWCSSTHAIGMLRRHVPECLHVLTNAMELVSDGGSSEDVLLLYALESLLMTSSGWVQLSCKRPEMVPCIGFQATLAFRIFLAYVPLAHAASQLVKDCIRASNFAFSSSVEGANELRALYVRGAAELEQRYLHATRNGI